MEDRFINKIWQDRVFIIAEAGVNHNGDLQLAKAMVDAAVEAGADAVKFQTFKADRLVTRSAQKADYQKKAFYESESQYDMLSRLELSDEAHISLFSYCKKKGIMFLSTPFDGDSADLLDELGVEMFKIGSGDLTNMPLLKHIGKKGKPVILSTGMSDLGEIEEAIGWLRSEKDTEIVLMHCTTNYPACYEDVNLRAMDTMKEAFKLPVGYSDHTEGPEVSIAAAALGACAIEKHFTLDKTMLGPDHKASMDFNELSCLVRSIRNVEASLGDGIKKCNVSEIAIKTVARKSIVANCRIKKGQIILPGDIAVKRPESGLRPCLVDYFIGKTAKFDIDEDQFLKFDMVE